MPSIIIKHFHLFVLELLEEYLKKVLNTSIMGKQNFLCLHIYVVFI